MGNIFENIYKGGKIMLLPSIFKNDLFDDFGFDMLSPFEFERGNFTQSLMRTDIRELDDSYELSIDLPGFKKEDIKANLKDGYLTISLETVKDREEKGKILRRERYVGKMSRSYFVGEGLKEEDIKAKFSDGVLKIDFPKEAPKELEEQKYIEIM